MLPNPPAADGGRSRRQFQKSKISSSEDTLPDGLAAHQLIQQGVDRECVHDAAQSRGSQDRDRDDAAVTLIFGSERNDAVLSRLRNASDSRRLDLKGFALGIEIFQPKSRTGPHFATRLRYTLTANILLPLWLRGNTVHVIRLTALRLRFNHTLIDCSTLTAVNGR